MTFQTLAAYLQQLESVSGRIEITTVLADVFNQLTPVEVPMVCNILLGQLRPAYEAQEFQLSTKSVIKALARVNSDQVPTTSTLFAEPDWSIAEAALTKQFQHLGDIGDVAAQVVANQHPKHQLSVTEVYERLLHIAEAHGAGSQDQKIQQLAELFADLDAISAKFSVRIIVGKLRLGFSTMTLIDALSWAKTGGKTEREAIESAWQRQTDIGHVAAIYLAENSSEARLKALAAYSIAVGVPVLPALCQRLPTAAEVIAKMPEVVVEPKYDGVRVQIHFRRQSARQPGLLRTFTRSLEESTPMFPELQAIGVSLNCDSCVLDGEAIGYDPKTGKLKPFQETITRKRKHEVAETASKIPLKFFIFDVLVADDVEYIDQPLRERKDVLKKLFKKNEVFLTTPFKLATTPETIQALHTKALAEGLEGVVIKQTTSVYQPGRKGWAWVKMKEQEGTRGKLLDTIDAVVMGYYSGKGKRTQFGLGAFLVGVQTADGQLVTIAKIGTGLSDEQFKSLFDQLAPHRVETPPPNYQVSKALVPDFWVKPEVVVEVAADELTNSPQHTAGVALRFPRLVRFRSDKNWTETTTVTELKTLMT